jgi:hypothetical protein
MEDLYQFGQKAYNLIQWLDKHRTI